MSDEQTNKLYVGNLSWNIKSEDLAQAFSEYGAIEDAFVMTDRATGRSKGFGFVTFGSEDDAAAAKEAMDGKDLDGRPVKVDFARPKRERSDYGSY